MKHAHMLHRIFLITMVFICATAVVIFVKYKVEAAVVGDTALSTSASGVTISNTPNVVVPINGVCGSANGTTSSTKPSSSLCLAGESSAVSETNTVWNWKCSGSNGGSVQACSAKKEIRSTVQKVVASSTSTPTPNATPGTVTSVAPVTTTATTSTPVVTQNTTPVQVQSNSSTPTATTSAPTDPTSSNSVSSSSQSVSEETAQTNEEVRSTVRTPAVTGAVASPVTTIPMNPDVTVMQNQTQTQTTDAAPAPAPVEVIKSQIIAEPVVVTAKNLVIENNPKVSGKVNATLKISNVEIKKKDTINNNLALIGKSEPNAIVTIYIFSNDPIVITVKADENGDWNYELDKELANGQHEAYVAITDNAGKIITKSEPIAFVKTAQAASVIPISELTANQSPMENAVAQYILIAIGIMSACLILALIAIGFLTYKRNHNEGIN